MDRTAARAEHAGARAGRRSGVTDHTSLLPIRMTPAFNRHALIGAILADRARSISTAPDQEAVIIVAHGPVPEDDNRRWLEDMAVLAEHTPGRRRSHPWIT